MQEKKSIYDEDLSEILMDRISLKAARMIDFTMVIPPKEMPLENFSLSWKKGELGKQITGYIHNFVRDELSFRLDKEIVEYKRKNRREYKGDIEDAKAGNRDALFRLIRFDKAWLFRSWVKELVLNAQNDGDNQFIKDVADALGKEPGVKKVVSAKDRHNREAIILAATAQQAWDGAPNFVDRFHEWLLEQDHLPEEMCDLKYFKAYLKKHKSIP